MIDKIELGSKLEGFVRELAASDRFKSVDAVLREGVRMLEAREAKLAEFNSAIEIGLSDISAGRVVSVEEAFDRVEKRMTTHLEGR